MSSLIYAIWSNFDFECLLEDIIYDLSSYCFDHDCTWQHLLQNTLGKVIQVTGVVNTMAAIYYDPRPNEDDH